MICPVGLGVVGRGHALYPAFVPDTQLLLPALQKWQLDFFFFFFGLSVSFVQSLPQLCMQAVNFSPV